MKFSDLKFKAHGSLPRASIAKHTFANQWQISVVTGHEAFYTSAEAPYEVAIFTPDGTYLSGDVFSYQTEEDIDAILEVITRDDIVQKDIEKQFTSDSDDPFGKALKAIKSMAMMDTI